MFEKRGVVSFTAAVELKTAVNQHYRNVFKLSLILHEVHCTFYYIAYRPVENLQDFDGRVFARRTGHIYGLDVCRVVEVNEFFRDLQRHICLDKVMRADRLELRNVAVCKTLTVSLFMNPHIAAATSQANRIDPLSSVWNHLVSYFIHLVSVDLQKDFKATVHLNNRLLIILYFQTILLVKTPQFLRM